MDTSSALPAARFDVPALSLRAIENWLADAGVAGRCAVEVVASTGSTNEDLILRARRGQPETPVFRVTDYQDGGRGRQGRSWDAKARHALLMSLAVPLAALPASLPSVTLAAGTTLADVLRARGVDVVLKWPNDLLYRGRKLGGILSELAVDPRARYTLVMGVGVNLHLDAEAREQLPAAAALDEALPAPLIAVEREAWIGRLGAAMLGAVDRFMQDGFAPFRARYSELLDGRGSDVSVVDGARTLNGRLLEVDGAGRLVIETGAGPRLVSVGDVSLGPR